MDETNDIPVDETETCEDNKKHVMCDVCKENPAKYRCPRCSQRTCSLHCVNRHKTDTDCNGKRDKTAYVAVKKFTDANLLSDYCFLEDAGRKCHSSQRDFLKRKHDKPKALVKLVRQAESQGIELRTMPYPMTKRKNNRTIFLFRSKEILWQIEWSFPQVDTVTYIDKKQKQTEILENILKKYFDPEVADPLVLHHLRPYGAVGLSACHLLMKAEGLPANKVRYHILDCTQSVMDNLRGKCIVEYPTVLVVLNDHLEKYTTLSKGEEDELWQERRKANFAKNRRHQPYKEAYVDDCVPTEKKAFTPSNLGIATSSEHVNDVYAKSETVHGISDKCEPVLDVPETVELIPINGVLPNNEPVNGVLPNDESVSGVLTNDEPVNGVLPKYVPVYNAPVH